MATSMSGADPRPAGNIKELTLRGIILGGLITLLFTAANVYLGLKLGITFANTPTVASPPNALVGSSMMRLTRFEYFL